MGPRLDPPDEAYENLARAGWSARRGVIPIQLSREKLRPEAKWKTLPGISSALSNSIPLEKIPAPPVPE